MQDSKRYLYKVLHAYDLDARQSHASLSKKLGLSRDIVSRQITSLEEQRIVRGYITVVDIGRLGYSGYAVYARLDTASLAKQEKLIAYLEKRKEIYWLAKLGGRYDILFAIQARSVVHFSEVLNDILKLFPFVVGSQFAIRMKATQFQRAYLVERPTKRIEGGFEMQKNVESLTPREKTVLKSLIDNPLKSIVDIAKESRLTRITVKSIVSNLMSRGVIQKFSSLISPRKLGYECYIILITLKRFDKSARDKLRKFAQQENSIIFYIEAVGAWHAEFHCEVATQEQLQELARKLREHINEDVVLIDIVPVFEYYLKYKYYLD